MVHGVYFFHDLSFDRDIGASRGCAEASSGIRKLEAKDLEQRRHREHKEGSEGPG